MAKKIATVLLLFALFGGLQGVFAQQPQQQQTPSQLALQMGSMLGQIQSVTAQWGPAIEALQQQVATLQRDLAAVTKERDELKSKHEPPKPAK